MLGDFLSKGSHLAQQQMASLGSAAVAARERALGLGMAAAETAAQKLEGVARELRERGRHGNHQVGEQQREDANVAQDDAGRGSNQTCRYASWGVSSASRMPMGLPAEQEAFLAIVEVAEEAELSSSSTPPHPSSSTTLPSCTDTMSNLITHTSGNYSVPDSSISLASTVMVAPCAEPVASSASSSLTLPPQRYILPNSSISLASTVMVPPVTEEQVSRSSEETAHQTQPADSGTHRASCLSALVGFDAQAVREEQDVGQEPQSRKFIQPGTWLELCCTELGSWRVGCIAECFQEHELFVDVLNVHGSFERNRFARGDLSLAVLGTHVQTPPPGYDSRPSVSRPGKLTYTSLATGANYQCLEHAWQEYFNTVARQMAASTSKALKPEACEAIRERLLKEVERDREAMHTDDLVAFPTREIPRNTALVHTSATVAQPIVLPESSISFNALAAASAAASVAPLPAVPRPGRISAPAVFAASSVIAHSAISQTRSKSQPHFAQPQPQPQTQPQMQLTLPQTHVPSCGWHAVPQHATTLHVQAQGGSKTAVLVIPATAAGSVAACGWLAVTAQAPAVRA
eukprot:TRINITY_DN32229_c0_g1_i1.p1 TRINITY_DN32229_c0_g1~~TRINITY_DN32229_c0_g1_i1.p1  ORF type:complete len:575 (-),score=99.04 TRINITY_DN32229_c0_g1_i1:289-2013(-)